MNISADMVCQDMMTLLGRYKHELMRSAEEHGLTQVQLAALYMVQQHGELPMGKVAHVLHCDPSNVTGIVDRLVSHQLMTRQECQTDRRAKTIALTPKGCEVIAKIMKSMPERLGCSQLTQAERQALHTAVSKIAA